MSKQIINAENAIVKYGNQDKLTCHEAKLLANAAIKLESRSLASVYKVITKQGDKYVAKAMLTFFPSGKYPEFKQFATAMNLKFGKKVYWSVWQGLEGFKNLSPVAQAEKKIAKQGGKIVTTTDAVRAKAQTAAAAAKAAKAAPAKAEK